ncbi:MAG: thioesterase family protein [Spirochaetales bacterium]|nr:thioesterase family protein [Spirochaetales bacterium]
MDNDKRKMYVEQPIKVKSYDVDFMQIVSNTVYVKYFEDLRMAILDEYFPLDDMMAQNNAPILAETTVKYKRPLTLKSRPTGRAWVEELDKSRWKARFEIVEEGKIHCEGHQIGYYFNMDSNRPVRFPEDFLEYYDNL